MVLKVCGRLALQMAKQIVPQVEFDLARDADDDPAIEKQEDALSCGQCKPAYCRVFSRVSPRFRSSMAIRMTCGKKIQTAFERTVAMPPQTKLRR
jgi:hypothetical protein